MAAAAVHVRSHDGWGLHLAKTLDMTPEKPKRK